MLRIHKRGSIVWKLYPQFYNAIVRKCDEIVEPDSGFLESATPYYKRWLTKAAINLKMDLENKMPQTPPSRLMREIEIKD
jgi:hypothetical protein